MAQETYIVPWETSDAIALRNYLAQNPKFIAKLDEMKPKITGTTMEESACTGRDRNGYDLTLENIRKLQLAQVNIPAPTNRPI